MKSSQKSKLICALGMSIMLIGCVDPAPSDVAGPSFKPGKGNGGGGGGSEIALDIMFRDDVADGVTSDDGGLYYDGVDRVGAVLMENGNLSFDWAQVKGKQTPIRFVHVDFGGQAGAPAGGAVDGFITTADPNGSGGLANMSDGGMADFALQVLWQVDAENTQYHLRYGSTCDIAFTADPATAVFATHEDENRWEIDGGGANLCSSPIKGGGGMQLIGTFSMPLRLTLERQ